MVRRDKTNGVPGNAVGDAGHYVHDGYEPRQPVLDGIPHWFLYFPLARNRLLFTAKGSYLTMVSRLNFD